MLSKEQLEQHAKSIRRNILKMVTKSKSGHPGGSLSGVEILTWLYFNEMDVTKENAPNYQRDRFVLSKGHAAPLLYATLAEAGIIEPELLKTSREINSKLQGHPNMAYLAGVDMSTGSLGQGISAAVGMALANKLDKRDSRVFVLLGDGECQEGQVWEAAMAAAHYKLDNLIVFVDYNGLQIDGKVQDVMNIDPLDEKFAAFGFNVITIDGHCFEEIKQALAVAKQTTNQPTLILAKTIKGKGVSFMESEAGWHGVAPSPEQLQIALEELR